MSGPPTLFSKARTVLRVLYPLVLAFVLFGMDLYRAVGLSPDAAAWVYLALVIAFYAAPGMLEYPVTTVGKARRVNRDRVEEDEAGHCTVCGASTEGGERREYAEQWVLLGIPLTNIDWGENEYCRECAGPETITTGVDPETEVFDTDATDDEVARVVEDVTDEAADDVGRIVETETDVETE